jgi:hypothetical protein
MSSLRLLINRLSSESESMSYVTTDGHSASLSWNKAHIWCLRPDLYYCLTVAGLLMWGALSDEWKGLARFETSLFVASSDSQGHGGGIRPHLHTGLT